MPFDTRNYTFQGSIAGMKNGAKISVSLGRRELQVLDDLVSELDLSSRSEGMREAIFALQRQSLAKAYDECFGDPEWQEEASLWDSLTADGLPDA